MEVRHLMCAAHELPTWVTPINDTSGPQRADGVVSPGAMLPLIPATAGSKATLSVSAAAAALPGLPQLNSLPSAPAAIYLDFNGSGSMVAYSEDADFTSFNASEQANITLAWRQMATYFAAFNVNVTTVKPTVPTAWGLITNSLTGAGYSYVGVFPNSLTGNPQSFNPAGDARTRQSGIAHEIGHNFGLSHQSDYDALGNKVNEYSSGYDATHGPIMGVDYAQSVHKWFIGHSSNNPSTLQDDVAVISSKIAARPNGGDGFRPDDVGGTIATATALPATAGGVHTATGIIERMADADAWSFTATSGRTAIDVDPVHPSGLIPKIEVYDAAGNLVATKDDADQRGTNNNDVSVSVNTTAGGTYYAVVKSHGDYGDIGQYDVTATDLPGGWGSQYIGSPTAVGGPTGNAGYAKYDSASGTFTIAGAGGSSWATSDQAQLAGTTLTGDGSVTVRVNSISNTNAKAGIMVRETSAQNAKLVTVNVTPTNGTQFLRRTTAGGSLASTSTTAAAFAPTYLRLTRAGSTFTAYRSTDGVNFTSIGSATVAMNAAVTVGLFAYSLNGVATTTATFDNLATTGGVNAAPTINPALPAPAALVAGLGTGTATTLSWADGAGETGYAVERSLDGTDFTQVATTAANVTTYTDGGLWGSMRYYYRVRALDAAGARSDPSAAVAVVNRPNAPGSVTTSSYQTTKIILDWRDVSGETGYRVERSTDGGTTFTTLATVGVNIPSYTDATVVSGTQYKYRVVATSAQGDSPYTPVVTESPRLAVTTGVAFLSVGSTAMSFKWNAVAGATGYKVYRSTDGSTFSTLTTLPVGTLSYTDGTVSPLGEYYYRVVGTAADTESMWPTPIFAAAPTAAVPPTPWQTQDIGAVAGSGATGWSSANGGTFTAVTSGSDIWNAADQMRYTSMALVGDGTIVARVATQEDTGAWAKAGVMIRETLAAGAKDAFMLVSSENGTAFQSRTSTNGATTQTGQVADKVAPYWVKLVRAGNVFTGYASTDGTTWVQAGTATITMANQVYVGLAADSYTTTTLNKTTFDNVKVTTAAPAVTAALVNADAAVVQRSMVTSLSVRFDRPVAALDAGAVSLIRRDGGAGVTIPVTVALAADGFGALLTFAGADVVAGSLADGVYDWVVDPSRVRDQAGQAGAGAAQAMTFHRLFGDQDGNTTVNNADNGRFRNAFGASIGDAAYNPIFDYDGNGTINNLDNGQFRNRFGTTLTYV